MTAETLFEGINDVSIDVTLVYTIGGEEGVEYLFLKNITPDNLKTETNGHI